MQWTRRELCLLLLGCACAPEAVTTGGGEGPPETDPTTPVTTNDPPPPPPPPPPPVDRFFPLRASPIAAENRRAGSRNWRLTQPSRELGAFVDQTSYLPGEAVRVHLGGPTEQQATWELWRLGYYGGQGGRRVLAGGPVTMPVAAPPEVDLSTGAVSCPWPETFFFTLPDEAVTGFYLLKVSTPLGQTYAPLVVREPTPAATTTVVMAFNTYQAYNAWGGTSLYVNQRKDFTGRHAYAVSFDRPYASGGGAGQVLDHDLGLITFAEAQGYDIAYASDLDLDLDPELTHRRRALVIQGHSEYWTLGMRLACDAAVARGTNLMNLGANNAYWRVRREPSKDGRANRLLVGYRDQGARDPLRNTTEASKLFRELGRPENALFGTMFGSWIYTAAPLVVKDPSHWAWTGSGVKEGTQINAVFGDETDRRYDNGATPAGLEVLGESTVESYGATLDPGELTLFTAPSGAQVFSAGSITFSEALAEEGPCDRRIQQLMANVFSRFTGQDALGADALKAFPLPPPPRMDHRSGVQVQTLTRTLTAPVAIAFDPQGHAVVADGNRIVRVSPTGQVSWIAGSSQAGHNTFDGVVSATAARFNRPRGLAVDAQGRIYVADSGNHQIRVIENGQVWRLAGGNWEGFADGVGTQALFTQPQGLALTAAGSLLVADTWNHRVREVTPEGVVSTWAGTGEQSVVDGPGASAALSYPLCVSLLPSGDAVIVEPGTGLVRTVSAAPEHTVSRLAGSLGTAGWADGPVESAQLSELQGAIASAGGIFLLDGASARVRELRDGRVRTLAGGKVGGCVDGEGESAGFGMPRAGALAPDGSLWVLDAREHAVRRLTGLEPPPPPPPLPLP
ncbi:hypothetical protein FGE12_05105 [Aggregicoccus sp. 17bor-14]|uniref:N,N-dimethylformamidase beta subunit family domain-containing protein n=1 Tax=Myxococcaceae TaxID=31 RepID=UPI00129D0FE5|nr:MULTISPECIES: N,N-dimethylformamidase beta subunit family domain-containing protein [Myxococcaceae]MBF5041759.1 hypothetical protein [Simulacricoccus sp. 17bor-14]MRI87540.1 hypothetical protein [Aggregicoccus sp. 17bor-14]